MSDAEVVQQEAPPVDEKPVVFSPEDRLRAEKLALQMQNIQLQLQIMQSDLQKAIGSRNTLVVQMNALRDEYLKKYGVDIAKVQINDDGTYTMLQQQVPGVPPVQG